jgi:hypothetical protein
LKSHCGCPEVVQFENRVTVALSAILRSHCGCTEVVQFENRVTAALKWCDLKIALRLRFENRVTAALSAI